MESPSSSRAADHVSKMARSEYAGKNTLELVEGSMKLEAVIVAQLADELIVLEIGTSPGK